MANKYYKYKRKTVYATPEEIDKCTDILSFLYSKGYKQKKIAKICNIGHGSFIMLWQNAMASKEVVDKILSVDLNKY